jgi:hypothetical protein
MSIASERVILRFCAADKPTAASRRGLTGRECGTGKLKDNDKAKGDRLSVVTGERVREAEGSRSASCVQLVVLARA